MLMLGTHTWYSACGFQENEPYQLKGQIMASDSVPLENAYLINYRTYNIYASNQKGSFSIPVQPGDSLVISYISYMRKIIYADSVKNNPVIFLEIDTFFLGEISVFENKVDEIENMKKNMKSVNYSQLPMPGESYTESERMTEFITANNNILLAQAFSVSIIKFSPSAVLGSLFKKRKNKKNSRKITSTKKEK